MKVTAQSGAGGCSKLLLVRHARTELAGRFCGHSDPPLDEEGQKQLPHLNQQLSTKEFTRVFSSDLLRTRQTAESIAAPRGMEVQFRSNLREIAFGSWEGLTWDELMAREPETAQHWLDHYPNEKAPGGESFELFRSRIRQEITAIADDARGAVAVVVTHAGVIRTFLQDLQLRNEGEGFADLGYCSVHEIVRQGSRWTLLPGEPMDMQRTESDVVAASDRV